MKSSLNTKFDKAEYIFYYGLYLSVDFFKTSLFIPSYWAAVSAFVSVCGSADCDVPYSPVPSIYDQSKLS